MASAKGSTSFHPYILAQQKEWDETSCPICMEHPHNAVLLICASFEKGCRCYICDTSYRHSNCLDRFKKLERNCGSDQHHTRSISPSHEHPFTERFSPDVRPSTIPEISLGQRNSMENTRGRLGEHSRNPDESHSGDSSNNLKCPLCRGAVIGWKVVGEARQYLDTKPRNCSRESCSFSGNYGELRRHARRVHPMSRPADVDPCRQRAWRDLEHQSEYGDILSAVRSAIPGAVMVGDYVIDNEGVFSHNRELGGDSGPWWATLFLFHMMSRSSGRRDDSRGPSRASRVRQRSPLNRYLWGESLLGLNYDDEDDDDDDDDDNEFFVPRRRRRLTRSRIDEERP